MKRSTRERTHRDSGSRGAILDTELYEDLLKVLVHRSRADIQDLANIAIGLAAAHPQQYLRLA